MLITEHVSRICRLYHAKNFVTLFIIASLDAWLQCSDSGSSLLFARGGCTQQPKIKSLPDDTTIGLAFLGQCFSPHLRPHE